MIACNITSGFAAGRPFRSVPAVILLLALVLAASACADDDTTVKTSTDTVEPAPDHARLLVDFFRGINEPRSFDWNLMLVDAQRLKDSGFNSVALEPPLLIPERAGGRPRVILEGAAITIPGLVDSIHMEGFAVFLAPTTASPEFAETIATSEDTLASLSEDVVKWATTAEELQVELFAPLSRCNLALGSETADSWLREILPSVREVYHGPVAAKVVADLEQPPAAGAAHDFERLDYSGYDYLVIDINPWGEEFEAEVYSSYVNGIVDSANMVAARDGLQGIIISDLRLGRAGSSSDRREGEPSLTEEQQAEAVTEVADIASPSLNGLFYYGWTLPLYGARDYRAEEALSRWFSGRSPDDANDGETMTTGTTGTTATSGTTGTTGTDTVVDNG